MEDQIQQLKENALKKVAEAKDSAFLEIVWRKYLGRKDGQLNKILRGIKDLSAEEKPKIGGLANQAREEIEEKIEEKRHELAGSGQSAAGEDIDITLPGKKPEIGHLHPHTQLRAEVARIFCSMGFEILEGKELETDYYNFEAINIPEGHPARDMWDTFWIRQKKNKGKNTKSGKRNKDEGKLLLRTHTSAMQVRVMEKQKPPLRVCVIGKCFRHEATDASHEHTLYQIEGFVVDKEITVANLIYTLKNFLDALFGQSVRVRLRPSYFPFTEPSFEMDFACLNCGGKGCPACSQTGWVEILGCGMINPKVYESAGYPKGAYTGFAFGVGLDRLAMMKHKIDDIRWFHSGDLRFIKQF